MQTVTGKSGQTTVKSHIRKVNIPQRQFMPISANDSPVFNKAIEREVTRELKIIML